MPAARLDDAKRGKNLQSGYLSNGTRADRGARKSS